MDLEKILGTDTGKEAFYKSDRNFDKIKTELEGTGVSGDAVDISYDSTDSELEAENVQSAIDEVNTKITHIDVSEDIEVHNTDANAHDDIRESINDLDDDVNLHKMPISGGVLENYREKLTTVSASDGSIDLSLGNVFVHTPSGNRTYSITNAVNGQAHSFTLIITMGSIVRTLTFPASVKWQGGEVPDMTTASKTYVLTFMTVDGGTTWLGMFGGEF